MDDLKLYAKDDNEFEGLLRIVKGFSDDIGISVPRLPLREVNWKV